MVILRGFGLTCLSLIRYDSLGGLACSHRTGWATFASSISINLLWACALTEMF
jgi:hypothetical protein